MPDPKGPRLWRRNQRGRNPVWIIRDRGRQIPTYCGDDEGAAKKRLAQYVADKAAYMKWVANRRTIRALEPPSPLPSAVRMRRLRERMRERLNPAAASHRPPERERTDDPVHGWSTVGVNKQ